MSDVEEQQQEQQQVRQGGKKVKGREANPRKWNEEVEEVVQSKSLTTHLHTYQRNHGKGTNQDGAGIRNPNFECQIMMTTDMFMDL